MGLMQKAVETYDAMQHVVGIEIANEEPLAPTGHQIARAQIEVTIDQNGRFIQAQHTDRKIIIPVTEESSGRTSAPAAHALCDQLEYLRPGTEKNQLYLQGLQEWEKSSFANPKLSSVLKYVSSGTIVEDLTKADLIKFDDQGQIRNDKEFVCWIVDGLGEKSGPVWNDPDLFNSFQHLYSEKRNSEDKVICMLTGESSVQAKQNPKGVFSLNGNAKLISSNDKTNFTYRGRFVDDQEALTIGYEASQKAHNALKWLLANQGVVRGGRAYLCWNPHGKKVAQPLRALFRRSKEQRVSPSDYQHLLQRAIDGYKADLPDGEEAIIASFDAATPGRLAVTYYAELQGSDFVDRLACWDKTCCWYDPRFGTSSPALYRLITNAYGTERGDGENAKMEVDDRIMAMHLDHLLLSKINQALFPSDIMRAIVAKAGNLQIFTRRNRQSLLFSACAVIRKYYFDYYKEEIDMALEPKRPDRSYQFGRLLAVMEKIERDTYDQNEDREPNAIRLQSIFVQRPGYAAKIVMDQLKNSYYPRLRPGQRIYYDRLIGEIMEIIDSFGPESYNKPLTETYLPGYYLQKNAMYTKKQETEETEEEKDEI